MCRSPVCVVDGAAHREGQDEPGRHAARTPWPPLAAVTVAAANGVGRHHLVLVAVEAVVERVRARPVATSGSAAPPKLPRCTKGKWRSVEEVVDHAGGRRRPPLHRLVERRKQGSASSAMSGMRRSRLVEAQPDEAVALGGVHRSQHRLRRRPARRRPADGTSTQRPSRAVGPPVVRALRGRRPRRSPADSGASRCGQRSTGGRRPPVGARHTTSRWPSSWHRQWAVEQVGRRATACQ